MNISGRLLKKELMFKVMAKLHILHTKIEFDLRTLDFLKLANPNTNDKRINTTHSCLATTIYNMVQMPFI